MTSIMAPICMWCAHFERDAPGLHCSAYTDGIPDEIITSRVDHRKPYTGDNGVQFVQGDNGLGDNPLPEYYDELLGTLDAG